MSAIKSILLDFTTHALAAAAVLQSLRRGHCV